MRILSIQQPWVWAIFHQGKDVENRNWETDYRGTIVVQAGKSKKGLGVLTGEPSPKDLVFGALVGVVELVDCVYCGPGRMVKEYPHLWNHLWAERGMVSWILKSPRLFKTPVPWKGQLGLLKPPVGFTLPELV